MNIIVDLPMYILEEVAYTIEAGLTDFECNSSDCWDGDNIVIGSEGFNEYLSRRIIEAWHSEGLETAIQNAIFDHNKSFKGYK